MKKRFFQVLPALGLLWCVACRPVTAGLETPQVGAPDPTQSESPAAASSSAPTPILEQAVQEQREGDLVVEIFSPPEVVVSVPEFLVRGKAPAGAVVSVNEEIILVEADGAFEVPIPLEEGPNVIEIVASNQEGYQVEFVLVVTYEPEL